jgi:hypothetical protein
MYFISIYDAALICKKKIPDNWKFHQFGCNYDTVLDQYAIMQEFKNLYNKIMTSADLTEQ